MKQRSAFSTMSAVAIVVATLAPAAPAISGSCAYTVSADGSNVRDSSGNCVRTSTWSKDQVTEACGGKPKAAPKKPEPLPEPAPEPVVEATPAPVAPAPPPAPTPTVERVTLGGTTLFATGSSKLSAEGKASVDQVVEQLRDFDTVSAIIITGHTDSKGSAAFNQTLSERRANTVRDYLISRGVNPALLSAGGAGENEPVADNDTEQGRMENRRVDIDIAGSKTVNK